MTFGVGKAFALTYKQEDIEKTQLKLIFARLGIKHKIHQHKYLKEFVDSREGLNLFGMGQANWSKWLNGPNQEWPQHKRLQRNVRICFRAFISSKSEELGMSFSI